MDEADGAKRVRAVFAAILGDSPLVRGTDVQKHLPTLPCPQLR